MNQKPKHTYPSPNSSIAAYGYNGLGGSEQASHGMSQRYIVTDLGLYFLFLARFPSGGKGKNLIFTP
jgi:hypothetical protein